MRSQTILAIGLVLTMSAACTREVPREGGPGTESAATVTEDLNDPGSIPVDVPRADTLSKENATSQALPRDTKGVVGSPQASNIKQENLGQSPDLQKRQSDLEVDQYSFKERAQFRDYMQARLQSIDTAIEGLKASPRLRVEQNELKSERDTEKRASKFDAVTELEKQYEEAAKQLRKVDTVQAQQWDSFKTTFKNQVEELEKNYEEALQASRR